MTSPVLIAGYYGSGNIGDEAILSTLMRDVRSLRHDLQFAVVSANPEETAARHDVRAILNTDIAAIIDAARAASAIMLGGGGVFHDYWGCASETLLTPGHTGIPFYAGFPLLAALMGQPSIIYAAGVGPLGSEEGRRLTRAAFEQATIATVRDVESRDLLHEIGVTTASVRVTADPAFNLQPDLAQGAAMLSSLCPDRPAPLVAVCLRAWAVEGSPTEWEDELARALDEFVERTGAGLVFVPFQALTQYFLTDDVAAANRVIDRMTQHRRVMRLDPGRSPEAVAGFLAGCDLVLAMRMHAIVFAASAAVPVVALPYDDKVTRLMTRLGVGEHVVPLTAVTELAERMSRAWECRDAVRAQLTAGSAELRRLAAENAELAVRLVDGRETKPTRPPSAEWLSRFALDQTQRLSDQQALVGALSARVEAGDEKATAASARADELAAQLAILTNSRAWRAAERFRHIRSRLVPPRSRRARAVDLATQLAVTTARRGVAESLAGGGRRAWRWVVKPRGVWSLEYRQAGSGITTLYTDRTDLFPDHRPRKPLTGSATRRVTASLIATVRNERAGIARWMASVAAQSRQPDEIVIVDAGSTDGTRDELVAQAARHDLRITVLTEPGANIARGRNIAVERARAPILVVTDLGVRLRPAWLERMVAPFENDEDIQVVAGWYVTLENGRVQSRRRWPTLDQVSPGGFLPSSRSVAFTRDAWAVVGGYPEWLTLTGEDTWFALELRRFCERWAFVPEAVVEWDAPSTMTEYWRKIYAWSTGDGESSVSAELYWKSFRRVAAAAAGAAGAIGGVAVARAAGAGPTMLALGASGLASGVVLRRYRKALGSMRAVAWELGAEAARAAGFLRGAARRIEVTARRHRGDAGMAFILSGVPIDDTGGGARCTQLALELLKQGWSVVFLSRFPRYETRDLDLKIRHPRLLTGVLADFPWQRFIQEHAGVFQEQPVVGIVEFPLPEFAPVAAAIRHAGGSVVYDLLDNWDSSLGGDWYSLASERRIISVSDVLVATAAPLAARLRAISGRNVALLPNAVNTDLFDPRAIRPRPADYPPAAWSMIYTGALWGDWFDWHLLRRLATAYPDAAVVVIGDYRGQMTEAPANAHFLGLKPQVDLPAYLAHADVAIVPWKTNAVTHATSPLKIYEYLAMRRPVVAPRLDALGGIPGILLSEDADAFVRHVTRAREIALDEAIIEAFVQDNSWSARIGTLLELIARERPTMRARLRGARP